MSDRDSKSSDEPSLSSGVLYPGASFHSDSGSGVYTPRGINRTQSFSKPRNGSSASEPGTPERVNSRSFDEAFLETRTSIKPRPRQLSMMSGVSGASGPSNGSLVDDELSRASSQAESDFDNSQSESGPPAVMDNVLKPRIVDHEVVEHLKEYLRWGVKTRVISPEQCAMLLEQLPLKSHMDSMGKETKELSVLVKAMRADKSGVPVGRRRHRFKHYHNVFAGDECVEWMVRNGYAKDRSAAVRLGRSLVDHGFVFHVHGSHTFEDDSLFYRFTDHMHSMALPVVPGTPALQHTLLKLVYHVHEQTVPQWLEDATAREMGVCFAAVIMWSKLNPEEAPAIKARLSELVPKHADLRLALLGYARANGVLNTCISFNLGPDEQNTLDMVEEGFPAKNARKMAKERMHLLHPFTGEVVHRVHCQKEFTSNAKPAWVKFYDAEDKPMLPDAVAKHGDDLRKDLAVQLVFKACEAIWAAAPVQWRLGTPYVRTYRVLVTSPKAGYLEFVTGRTVKDVEAQNGWSKVDLFKFAPSAVGSYVAGFVMGVRDRHSENWMLIGDPATNPELLQIDFGYMLMENPGGFPLDTPRLTMQPSLVKLMQETKGPDGLNTMMEDFQHDLIQAYAVLRQHQHALISFAKTTLANVYNPLHVESFMWGRHCFHTAGEEKEALEWFEDKVLTQMTKTLWRRGAKHALVKAYYAAKKII